VRTTVWLVTKVGSSWCSSCSPRLALVPYSTWLVAGSSVVQVMVAPVAVMSMAATSEITGAVRSGVMKVKSPERPSRPRSIG
jgi:hypothetical protein